MRMGDLVGVLTRDALVHVEQVAVAPLDDISLPSRSIASAEVEVHAVAQRPDAEPLVDHRLGIARGDVAGDQVAERRVLALEVVVAVGFGISRTHRGRSRPMLLGTQMRPSLRSDSDMSTSFDWNSSEGGMQVGWICV
jgi:hypothetical protein